MIPSIVPTDRLGVDRAPSSSGPRVRDRLQTSGRSVLAALAGLTPLWRDALVYAASALFAGLTAVVGGISLYRQWGQLAFGPYVLATVVMVVVAWWAGRSSPARRWRWARIVAFLIVLFGATVIPLTLEVVWRTQGNASQHVQPEVVVVEQAGVRAAQGKDPYRVVDRDGHVVIHETSEPVYELYYPYLPGMVLFGFSSSSATTGTSRAVARLTDARIQFLVFTALVTVVALSRIRPPSDARYRAAQVLTVLPTAALPLATGGDDMPVAALMLLGLVGIQRRRPVLAGLALGAASSLKFTAWPLVVLALWAATDRRQRRAVGRYLLGVVVVMVPVILPVALQNLSAFDDNVIRFPLGLAGVSSPAASALPGHIFVSAFPGAHRIYVVTAGLVGCAVLIHHLWRRPPRSAAAVATLTGWVMLIAILLAPATRVGYLLYPVNLFVWAWMLSRADDPAEPAPAGRDPGDTALDPGDLVGQSASGSSNTSTEYGVMPAEVAGDTTTPTSQ